MERFLFSSGLAENHHLAVFFAHIRLSFSYFQRNGVSLIMTLAVPVLFLVLYSYSYYLSVPNQRIEISVAASVPAISAAHLEQALDKDLFVLTRVPDAELERSVSDGKARLAVEMKAGTAQFSVHASKFDRAFSDLVLHVLNNPAASAPTPRHIGEIHILDEGSGPLFFLPSIILMSLLNLGLFTTGSKTLQERASGTLRLYRMLPTPMWTYFAAELITKLLLATLLIGVFLAAATLLLDIRLGFAVALKATCAGLICASAFIAMGIAIGCTLGRYSSGVHVFTLVNLLMMFLGDLFFSASKFSLTKAIALCLPTTYSADILKSILLEVPNRFPYWISFGYLVCFSVLAFAVAALNFRFTAKE